MAEIVLELFLMVRRFFQEGPEAVKARYVSGLLNTICLRRLLPCRISFSITPAFRPISGSLPIGKRKSAKARSSLLTRPAFLKKWLEALAINVTKSVKIILQRLRRFMAPLKAVNTVRFSRTNILGIPV